jgi:hypothetical protein
VIPNNVDWKALEDIDAHIELSDSGLYAPERDGFAWIARRLGWKSEHGKKLVQKSRNSLSKITTVRVRYL